MNWHSVGEFLHMGGYGVYVWGSFGMCALVLAAEVVGLRARRRHLRRLSLDQAGEADDIEHGTIHEA